MSNPIELNSFYAKIACLADIAAKLRHAGLTFKKEPREIITKEKARTNTVFLGEPEKHVRGIPFMTIRSVEHEDNILKALTEISSACTGRIFPLPEKFTKVQYNFTMYEPISNSALYFKPVWTLQKLVEPVYIVPNWETSLVDPGDLGPIYKNFVLSRNRDYMTMALYTIACWMIVLFSESELLLFIMTTESTAGWRTIAATIQEQWSLSQDHITNIYNRVQDLRQTSALFSWLHQLFKRQLFANTDYRDIIMWLGGDAEAANYAEITQLHNMYTRLYNFVVNHMPQTVELTTKSSYTAYSVHGTTTTVTTYSFALNSDGSYCHLETQSKTVLSQNLIRSLKLFKQTVKKPKPTIDTFTTDQYKNVSIPCNNWNDVERLTSHLRVTQKGWNTRSEADFSEVIDSILSYRATPGVVQAQIQWDGISKLRQDSVTTVSAFNF